MWTRPLLSWSRSRRAAVVVSLLLLATGIGLWTQQVELTTNSVDIVQVQPYDSQVELASFAPADSSEALLPTPFTLSRGQTMHGLLLELGLDRADANTAVAAVGRHLDLRRLRAGETGLAYIDQAGQLDTLRLKVARQGWLDLERSDADWDSQWRPFVRTVHTHHVAGELRTTLLADIAAAGGSPRLAFAMADVLQWDLDFNRDLRLGDRFQVLYEEVRLDGEVAEIGRVLSLSYENRGKTREAYLYDRAAAGRAADGQATAGQGKSGDYYDASGRPLQKMFLRSPLPFTRVTSRFTHRRFHPVLKKYRPHYGVDFGAPTGTPVRVTAGGTVVHAARAGGAGKMVKVRHAQGYESAYLHLSKYAVRRGQRVSQGEVIGYVGSTGYSTGPHLDYRIKHNGKYLDPMKLQNRPAEPIPQHQLAEFFSHRDTLRRGLEGALSVDEVRLALAPMPLTLEIEESATGHQRAESRAEATITR